MKILYSVFKQLQNWNLVYILMVMAVSHVSSALISNLQVSKIATVIKQSDPDVTLVSRFP